MLGNEWHLDTDNVIDTTISVEDSLSVVENDNRAIRATAAELALASQCRRKANGIVEGETEGLVDFLAALATVEQVRLNIVTDGE